MKSSLLGFYFGHSCVHLTFASFISEEEEENWFYMIIYFAYFTMPVWRVLFFDLGFPFYFKQL